MKTKEILDLYKKYNVDLEIDAWSEGIDHHPKSIELMEHLMVIDWHYFGDCFCWKKGGDGDNGETLMYELDFYFELQDKIKRKKCKKKNCENFRTNPGLYCKKCRDEMFERCKK